jgi:hypothetical protein
MNIHDMGMVLSVSSASSVSSDEQEQRPAKVAWTSDEDECLTRLVDEHGKAWALIASKLEGGGKRSDRQCLNRYKVLDPTLNKGKFSVEEDASLTRLVEENGPSWALIALKLGGKRSDRQCWGRWRTLGKPPKTNQGSKLNKVTPPTPSRSLAGNDISSAVKQTESDRDVVDNIMVMASSASLAADKAHRQSIGQQSIGQKRKNNDERGEVIEDYGSLRNGDLTMRGPGGGGGGGGGFDEVKMTQSEQTNNGTGHLQLLTNACINI